MHAIDIDRDVSRPLDPVSLQLFAAVCEKGNIARAAVRESLVASALSKRIAALEAEVGVPLLLRRRRGVDPTDAGQALLARARELLAGLDQLRIELSAYGQGVQGSVRVFASPSALTERLPDDVAAFVNGHPRIRISLEVRYRSDAAPAFQLYGHCRDCQRASGSASAPIIFFPEADLTVEGEVRYFASTGSSGKTIYRGFCPTCGSQLFGRLERVPGMLSIRAGTLDDPSVFQPRLHIHTSQAVPWEHLAEDLGHLARRQTHGPL